MSVYIRLGDGTFDSYAGNIGTARHAYSDLGPSLVQAVAVVGSAAGGYTTYGPPAVPVAVTTESATIPLTVVSTVSSASYTVKADVAGNVAIYNGSTFVVGCPAVNAQSISITGLSQGTVTVDESGGDPVPPVGMSTDARTINVDGADGASDTLLTTTTALAVQGATYLGASIRHPAGSRVVFDGAGSGDSVFALTGSITIAGDGSGSGPDVLVGTSATAYFDGTQTLSTLTVLPGGLARVQQDGTSVLTTYGLNLSPATTAMSGGILDVADNDVIVKASSTDTAVTAAALSAVTGWLAAGSNNGKWDDLNSPYGPAPAAIISTVAGSDAGLATLAAGQVGGAGGLVPGLFDGQAVDAGDVPVRFTYVGDDNLDGVVDGSGTPLPPLDDGSTYTLPLPTAAVISAGLLSVSSWTFNWGDGSINSASGSATTATHDYTAGAGMYSVAVSAAGLDSQGRVVVVDLPHKDLVVNPPAPTGLSATESTAGTVDLALDLGYGTGSEVVVTDPVYGVVRVVDVSAGVTSQSIAGLIPDKAYTFGVSAVQTLADGNSAQSDELSCTATAPAATLSVTGSVTIGEGSSGNTLSLSSGASSGVTAWQIVWTDQNGSTLATASVSGAGGVDPFPSSTTSAIFAVISALDSTGATFTLSTFECDVIPVAPANVQATMYSSTEIQLRWANNSHVATGFDILRSIDGGSFGDIGSVGMDTTLFTDTGLDPSDVAVYEVAANGYVGAAVSVTSPSVPTASVTTPTGKPTLTTLASRTMPGSVILVWTYQGSDDSGFQLETEDRTLGQNFSLYSWPGAVDQTGVGTQAISNLTEGDVYGFRIRAEHTDGTVSDYAEADYTPQGSNPPTVSASPGNDSSFYLNVNWAPPSDLPPDRSVLGYELDWRGSDVVGNGWEPLASYEDDGVTTTFRKDVGWGQTGQFRVRATYDDGSVSAWGYSNQAKEGNASGAPPAVSETVISATEIDLTISKAEAENALGGTYGQRIIYYGISYTPIDANANVGTPVNLTDAQRVIAAGVSETIPVTGLDPSVKYDFAVYASWHPFGEYGFSVAHIYAGTGGFSTLPPSAPLYANAIYDPSVPKGQIKLWWVNTPSNEDSFEIYRESTLIAKLGVDQTSYTYNPADNGPYFFHIFSTKQGCPLPFQGAVSADTYCSAIGGPDITDHLLAIRAGLSKEPTDALAALLTGNSDEQRSYWDILKLKGQSVTTSHNSGILPDGSHTVSVAGHVYPDAEVNYWLYGSWVSLAGGSFLFAYDKVLIHGATTKEGPFGKLDWFMAGYVGDVILPSRPGTHSHQFDNVLPARLTPLGEDTGPLWWQIGKYGIEGWDGSIKYGKMVK